METTCLSKCCKEKAIPDEMEDGTTIYSCLKCEKECEVEEVCAYCLGEGEVVTDEQVYPGEPHYAPIGTRKCICQIKEEDGERE